MKHKTWCLALALCMLALCSCSTPQSNATEMERAITSFLEETKENGNVSIFNKNDSYTTADCERLLESSIEELAIMFGVSLADEPSGGVLLEGRTLTAPVMHLNGKLALLTPYTIQPKEAPNGIILFGKPKETTPMKGICFGMELSEIDAKTYTIRDSFIKVSEGGLEEKAKVVEVPADKADYRCVFLQDGDKFLLNYVEVRLVANKETPVMRIKETTLLKNDTTSIVAPVVSELSTQELEDKVNTLLADAAQFYYSPENDGTLEIWYEINRSDHILSVTYYGYYHQQQAAHPNNYIYTLNIDMSTGEQILAKDLPLPSMQEIISSDDVIWVTPSEQEHITPVKEFLLAEIAGGLWDNAELDKPNAPVNVYLTNKALGVRFAVPYALGSNVVVEVPFKYGADAKPTAQEVPYVFIDFDGAPQKLIAGDVKDAFEVISARSTYLPVNKLHGEKHPSKLFPDSDYFLWGANLEVEGSFLLRGKLQKSDDPQYDGWWTFTLTEDSAKAFPQISEVPYNNVLYLPASVADRATTHQGDIAEILLTRLSIRYGQGDMVNAGA